MNRFLSACGLLGLAATIPVSQAADTRTGPPPALYSASLLQFINAYRSQHGLPSLELARHLTRLAREHSRYMAERGDISHDQFENRFARAGSTGCVENVGWNYRDAHAQFQGWKESPGHNAAMLDPGVRRGGIAIYDSYVTFFACS
jgi:uncharacterized protein YkwD